MHPAEGTLIELKGRLDVTVDPATLVIPEKCKLLSARTRSARSSTSTASRSWPPPSATTSTPWACARSSTSSTAASRSGASSCVYLGTSVPVEKVLDAAIEHAAQARAHQHDHHPRRHPPPQHGEARRPGRREGRARQAAADQRRHAGHRRAGPGAGAWTPASAAAPRAATWRGSWCGRCGSGGSRGRTEAVYGRPASPAYAVPKSMLAPTKARCIIRAMSREIAVQSAEARDGMHRRGSSVNGGICRLATAS